MKKHALTFSIIVAVVFAYGCNNSTVAPAGNGNLVQVEKTDGEMNAAIARAKETFQYFEANWKSTKNDGYSIKLAMPTSDGGVEHIWFNPIKIEGSEITAECANDPVDIPGLKMGDVKTLNRSLVSDWMIIVGNKCYGGYTIKALAEQRSKSAPPYEFIDVGE